MATLTLSTRGLEFPHSEELVASAGPHDGSTPVNMNEDEWEVFQILSKFIQPESDLSRDEAVEQLLEFYADGYNKRRPINDVSFDIAEQISHDHPSHRKLAELIRGIGMSEKRLGLSRHQHNPETANAMFYQQLFEDITDRREGPQAMMDNEQDPLTYANHQAFLANLMAAGFDAHLGQDLKVATLGASEIDMGHIDHSVGDAWVLGAAQWPIWNAKGIFALANSTDETFTLADWKALKESFRRCCEDDRHSETCVTVAAEAERKMTVEEKAAKL